MDNAHTEIAQRIRQRAFRTRNPRAAMKLLALADEVPSMHFPNAPVILAQYVPPTPPPRRDLRAQHQLRRRRRRLDAMRPLNRHPRILERLAELLPRAKGRPAALLRAELHLEEWEIASLADAIEESWGIAIDRRAIGDWETLNDVGDSVADALATLAA
jgi:hypothetical protein